MLTMQTSDHMSSPTPSRQEVDRKTDRKNSPCWCALERTVVHIRISVELEKQESEVRAVVTSNLLSACAEEGACW